MNVKEITKLQKEHGFYGTQEIINDGTVWHMEGGMGRHAMDTLWTGATMLPKKDFRNAYGGHVPSRDMIKDGSTGSKENCINFWNKYKDSGILIW